MIMLPTYVPDVLARLPQWVFWQSELTPEGKPTKVPYQVSNWKRLAASTRPEEWDVYDLARTNYNVSDRTGVGFVFQQGGGIFGIDVDDITKVAPEDQEASMRLRALIHEHFPTYCEMSPSGTGRHYLGFGTLPDDVRSIKDSKYGIEIYDKERFFTFTGDVLDGRSELVECQAALTDLAHTMRASVVGTAHVHSDQQDDRSVDAIIAEVRTWSNGAEFSFIMDNPLTSVLARYKNDHSSADFALANFIATATKDADKAVEMFRRSPLYRAEGKGGYKPEDKYIRDYLIGFCFAKVWGENVVKDRQRKEMAAEGKAVAAAIAAKPAPEKNSSGNGVGYAVQFGVDLPLLDVTRTDCPMPPGLAGDFIKSIHDACHNPLPEFAVAVGMAYLSGLTGRAYRFQNQGLNAFFMVGAKSSTGKTQSITALQTLLAGVEGTMLPDRLYAVSGKTVQGLHTYFERAPAGAWITDECGAQVKALTEPTGQSDHELKDAINSLFDAARPGKKWTPPASRTSQREDKAITCLSVGIGWFTTREKIYGALNDTEVADGFLSRFVPIFYNGVMGDDNYTPIEAFPDNVTRTLKTLWSVVQENDVHMPVDGVANQSKMVTVGIRDEAAQALRYFSTEARNVTRRAQDEQDDLPEAFVAMARVGITAQRLAAVCAVMDNPVQPIITLPHIEWAVQLVGSRMLHVLELMATGEVGSGDNIAFPVVVKVMKDMLKKYPQGVPKSKLHERLRHRQPFRTAKYQSPQRMVKQTLLDMVDDRLVAIETQDTGQPGRPPEFYLPTNDPVWRL